MEANIIAAHILIDEDDLPDYMQMGYTLPAIAAELEVPEDLLLIKIEQMIRLNYYNFKINEMYRKPRGNYLKDFKDDVDNFFYE